MYSQRLLSMVTNEESNIVINGNKCTVKHCYQWLLMYSQTLLSMVTNEESNSGINGI